LAEPPVDVCVTYDTDITFARVNKCAGEGIGFMSPCARERVNLIPFELIILDKYIRTYIYTYICEKERRRRSSDAIETATVVSDFVSKAP